MQISANGGRWLVFIFFSLAFCISACGQAKQAIATSIPEIIGHVTTVRGWKFEFAITSWWQIEEYDDEMIYSIRFETPYEPTPEPTAEDGCYCTYTEPPHIVVPALHIIFIDPSLAKTIPDNQRNDVHILQDQRVKMSGFPARWITEQWDAGAYERGAHFPIIVDNVYIFLDDTTCIITMALAEKDRNAERGKEFEDFLQNIKIYR